MQYQQVINEKGERLWIPLLAGAAILTAPFWLNNNKCCNNSYYPVPYLYPVYPVNYNPYPYQYQYQYPYQGVPIVQNFTRKIK